MIGYLGSLDAPLGAVDYDVAHDNDPDTSAAALREDIEGLADYPILDESDESELESDTEHEAWSEYGCRDFAEFLTTPHKGIGNYHIPSGIPLAVLCDGYDDEHVFDHTITYASQPGDPAEATLRKDLSEIYCVVLGEYGSGETCRHEAGGGVHFYFDNWYRTFCSAREKRAGRLEQLHAARASDPAVAKLETAMDAGDSTARDVLVDLLAERGFDKAADHVRYYRRDTLSQVITSLDKLAEDWSDDVDADADEEPEYAASAGA